MYTDVQNVYATTTSATKRVHLKESALGISGEIWYFVGRHTNTSLYVPVSDWPTFCRTGGLFFFLPTSFFRTVFGLFVTFTLPANLCSTEPEAFRAR